MPTVPDDVTDDVTDDMTFVPAARADRDVLASLMAAYYREDGLEVAPESTRRTLEHFFGSQEAGQDLGRIWFLQRTGERVGYLALTWVYSLEYGGQVGAIDELYVRPASRGRGVGRAALAFAERICKEMGMRGLSLEVEPENDGAARLYRRAGFRDVHRTFLCKRF